MESFYNDKGYPNKKGLFWEMVFDVIKYSILTFVLYLFVESVARMFIEVLPKYCELIK